MSSDSARPEEATGGLYVEKNSAVSCRVNWLASNIPIHELHATDI